MSDLETAIINIAALEDALALERGRLRAATDEIARLREQVRNRDYAIDRLGELKVFEIERLRAALELIRNDANSEDGWVEDVVNRALEQKS